MIRPARPEDAAFIRDLWTGEANRPFLDPPIDGQIEAAIAEGNLLLWQDHDDGPAGFALLTEWLPRAWGLREFATLPRASGRLGFGRPFLAALLIEVFDHRGGHRLGLDCTADNVRALRFFQAAGFVREGCWRECWQREDGQWVDCVFFALLAREWRAMQAGPV